MSGYTAGEIVVWMLLAAVLGFALGWIAREVAARSHARRVVLLPVGPPTHAEAVQEPAPEPAPEPEPESEPEPAAVIVPGPHPGSAVALPGGGAPSDAYVVKVTGSSKIYHGPSSPAYARTTATLWFTDAEAAEQAGFRKPKNA